MGAKSGGISQGPAGDRPAINPDSFFGANTANVDQAIADGHTWMPGRGYGNVIGYGQGGSTPAYAQPQAQQRGSANRGAAAQQQAAPAQTQQQAAPAMAQNQYYGGGGMFGINNQQIQEAIAKWRQQQNPEQVETPPAVEEPPPATETQETRPVGFQDDGILGALYGGNSSYSERLTNGLNYAQAPTYAPNPKSTGSLEWWEKDDNDGLY